MAKQPQLREAFRMGLDVAAAIKGFQIDDRMVQEWLRGLVDGSLTLLPTTEEEMQNYARITGRHLSPIELEHFRSSTSNFIRAQMDASNKELATLILQESQA